MRPIAAAALLVLAATSCAAPPPRPRAGPAPPAAAAAGKVHRVERLGEHAHAIFGGGGNVGLFVGDREAVLVDTQLVPLAPGLLETVASLTDS